RIGQSRPSWLEEDQPTEARRASKNAGITRHLPHHLEMGKRLGQEYQIRRSISHDLERNVSSVVGPRVLGFRKLAHAGESVRTAARAPRASCRPSGATDCPLWRVIAMTLARKPKHGRQTGNGFWQVPSPSSASS